MKLAWCGVVVLVYLLWGADLGRAQTGSMSVTIADSNVVAENVLRRLFRDIALTSEQTDLALSIIKETFREQMSALDRDRQNGVDPRPAAMRLRAQRDSLLRAILRSESDRSLFDRNASSSRVRRP